MPYAAKHIVEMLVGVKRRRRISCAGDAAPVYVSLCAQLLNPYDAAAPACGA